MKFEKEINFYDTPAIATKFSEQDTSLEAINGKISRIISNTELAQYDNGQNTMASALSTAVSTATQNAQTLSTLRSSFNTKSGEFDDFVADYNDQLQTTTQNISTVGSVAASKGKIFSAQPSIPYQVNDIWLKNGQNGSEIYRCITAKTDAENDAFSNDDWVKATSYATTAELGNLSSTVSTIDQKANSISLKVESSNNTHTLEDIQDGENYDLGDFVVSEGYVKRVTREPNRDGNGNAIYRSSDLTDVTDKIPTSAEISTAIDHGISNATIEADQINLKGKTIYMNSKDFAISSNYLYVSKYGEITANKITVSSDNTDSSITMKGSRHTAGDRVYYPTTSMTNDGLYSRGERSHLRLASASRNYSEDLHTDPHNESVIHVPHLLITSDSGEWFGVAALGDNFLDFTKSDTNWDHASWIRAKSLNCHNLNCTVSKRRVIQNTKYGDLAMYSYETPTPMFGDIGEGIIGEDGQAYIYFDPKFLETIKTNTTYQVFLQKYGEGDLYVAEREKSFFVVKGTPNIKFGWETKHQQAKVDYKRLDNPNDEKGLHKSKDYGIISDSYINNVRKERVTV